MLLVFNIISEATIGALSLSVQYLCDVQDANPSHWSRDTSHPPYLLSRLPWGWYFDLKVSWDLCCGLKQRSGRTVCFNSNIVFQTIFFINSNIHSNSQKIWLEESLFKQIKYDYK